MNNQLIATEKLTKIYHGRKVVDNISLCVPEGKIYGFLGPNGAGKSTTMKMLLGLTDPSGGKISIFGKEMNQKNRISILKQTGSLIESPSYYGNLTGYENLKISCILKKTAFFRNKPCFIGSKNGRTQKQKSFSILFRYETAFRHSQCTFRQAKASFA